MTMDLGQLSQMTTWLDEEHRRSKAEFISLQQKVQRLETELEDQSQVLRSLEERVAGIQAQQITFTRLDAALKELKEDVSHMLAQADERRQQESRETAQVRAIERDNVSRTLNEIRSDLQRLPRLDEEVSLRKVEQQRLGESVLAIQQNLNTLGKEVENKLRSVSFLEDGRQQDTKRIARLQQESLEALKRLEQQGSRLQMLEDVMQRQERDTGELKGLVSQVRTSQQEFIEKQLLTIEQFKRQMTEWSEQLDVYTKKMTDFSAKMQTFSDTFREDRQVVDNIERFQEQIRREQAQVAELQRLGEERQRRQLEQWQEENEKRWRKELLRWDHQWGEQAKYNGQTNNNFSSVEERLARHRAEIEAGWKFIDFQINYRTQETRRWLSEANHMLEQRPKKE
jgi:ABC-type transporter Mla subunit MlaD